MAQTSEHTAERRDALGNPAQDRFDRVRRTGRVGAHRIAARPRYVWQYLIAGLLGFALLTTLGIIAVHSAGATGELTGERPTSSPSTEQQQTMGEVDPEATVAVLNGTATPNLAAAVDQIITDEGWGQIRFSGNASETDVELSAVFYTDPADAAAAAGLASKLGLSVYVTEDYADYEVQLVVLLGANYTGPGVDEARELTEEAGDEPAADNGVDAAGTGADQGDGVLEVDSDGDSTAAGAVDPETGLEIDPATGWLIDPGTGWPIDPATGLPTDPSTIAP
ncbi:MAG: LytR C-terminal domain-containing protein [Leucobacter sp.]